MKDFSNKITASGELNIQVVCSQSGKILDQFKESNLVVNLGRANVAKLIGGSPDGKPVTKVACGESSAPADLADTTLLNQFTKGIDSATYPAGNKVSFAFTFGETDANGLEIVEFGLFNSDSLMFARKVRETPIVKTSAIIIAGIWTITIN